MRKKNRIYISLLKRQSYALVAVFLLLGVSGSFCRPVLAQDHPVEDILATIQEMMSPFISRNPDEVAAIVNAEAAAEAAKAGINVTEPSFSLPTIEAMNREEVVAAAIKPAEPEPVPPEMSVKGMLYNTSRPSALINGQLVELGDEILGVKITEISAEGVTYTFNGKTLVAKLPETEVKPTANTGNAAGNAGALPMIVPEIIPGTPYQGIVFPSGPAGAASKDMKMPMVTSAQIKSGQTGGNPVAK